MSIIRCLPDLVTEGKLSQEQADMAAAVYGRRRRHYERSMGEDAADALAGADAAEAVARQAARKKRLTLLKVQAQKNRLVDVIGPDGAIDPKALPKVIVRVEARRRAIEGRAFALIDGILADHRRTLTGALRNPAQMGNIVRELFGQDTGDLAARELADAWRQAGEMLRQRFNAAGGEIGKLEDWGLPQSHDSGLVRRAGWGAWRGAVLPLLDRGRMIDDATGQPFDDDALDAVLRDVFETIKSEGWAKRTPGAAGEGAMAARRAEHRFLHFRDADAWMAYQERFGQGSPFDAMMGHIRGMARDIAAMERLGPDPAATVRWLVDGATKGAQLLDDPDGKAVQRATSAEFRMQRLWQEYTGELTRPINRNLAIAGGTYRAIASAAKLGTAPISAIGDVATGFTTRAFNGLPKGSIFGDYLKLLNPADDADRRMAIRLGLGAEGWASIVATGNRYMLGEMGFETSRRIADGVMRISGLEAMTNAGKWANGLAWLGHITEESGKRWAQLDEPFRRAMARYGIFEDGWDKIRSTPIEEDGGVHWIKPHNIEDQDLGDTLLEMIHSEGDFAVPAPDIETRAIIHSKARPGTAFGELVLSGPLLFKSFAVAVAVKHLGRAIEMPSLPGKLGYLALLAVPMTIAGTIAEQLYELAKGRDPRPLNDPRTLGAGILRGGGFSLAGDLLGLMAEKRVGGLGEWLAGPLGSDIYNTGSATIDLVRPMIDDSEAAARAQAAAPWKLARVIKQDLPGQNLWYARTAFDRMVADQVQELLDPNVARSRRQVQRNAAKLGQGFWWEPGETQPDRLPDFNAMFEEPPQ